MGLASLSTFMPALFSDLAVNWAGFLSPGSLRHSPLGIGGHYLHLGLFHLDRASGLELDCIYYLSIDLFE